MEHERLIVWRRWPKFSPPNPDSGEIVKLLVSVRSEEGCDVEIARWDGKRFLKPSSSTVIAWAKLPEPLEPLPDDYWHPDQVAARRFMGEEDEE